MPERRNAHAIIRAMAGGRRNSRNVRAAQPDGTWQGTLASLALAAAVLGSLLLVDVHAESAFDAPKRLAAMLGIALAAAIVVAFSRGGLATAPFAHRVAAALFAAAMAAALLSSILSPRREVALDSFRAVAIFAAVPLIGASTLIGSRHWRAIAACFVAGAAINCAISIGQVAGILHPFQYATTGGRANTSALIGNDGALALIAAMAAVVMVDGVTRARTRWRQILAGSLAMAFAATIVINRNLTSIIALTAGVTVVLVCRLGWRRTLVAGGTVFAAIATGIAVSSAARSRVMEAGRDLIAGRWNAVLSFRGAPWGAAVDMIRARPLGWGAGTFAAEFVPHLLNAELTFHQRLTNSFLVGSYAEAHCDYLQAAAELGLAATVLAVASATLTAMLLWRRRHQNAEAPLLLGLIMTSAVAALTWFPLQRPATSLVVLLAMGRAWRASLDD
jgi:O-antigen ligase